MELRPRPRPYCSVAHCYIIISATSALCTASAKWTYLDPFLHAFDAHLHYDTFLYASGLSPLCFCVVLREGVVAAGSSTSLGQLSSTEPRTGIRTQVDIKYVIPMRLQLYMD